ETPSSTKNKSQHAKRQDFTHLLPPPPTPGHNNKNNSSSSSREKTNNNYVNKNNNDDYDDDYDYYDDDYDEIKSRNVNQYERRRSLAQLRPAAAPARLTPRPVRRNPALPVVVSWSFFLIITTLSFTL
ncbi:MAG: hypothetical protein MHMPM18_005100, partial [Marteilia pararefringens]